MALYNTFMNETLPTPTSDIDLAGIWHTVIYGLDEGIIVSDRHGRLLVGNPAVERILDLSLTQMQGRSLAAMRWQVVGEDGFALDEKRCPTALCLQSGRAETAILGVGHARGSPRWLQVKAQPIFQAGQVTHVVTSFSDVTEQCESRRHLEQEAHFRTTLLEVVTESLSQGLDERFYQRLLEGAAQAIPGVQAASLLLLEGECYKFVAAVNYDLEALRQVYLLTEEMYRGRDAYTPLLVYGFDNRNVPEERRGVIDEVGRADQIKVCMSIPVLLHGEPIAYFSLDNFEDKDVFGSESLEMGRIFAQQTASLWQRFELEAETRRLAFYDTLTGLPNRRLLYDRLRYALAQRRTKDQPLAVMFIDLDNFKDVNDNYGHSSGDDLLQSVATRLSSVVRQGDTLARWGGDEFVLLTELERPEDAAVIAEKLLEALERPFYIGGQELHTQGSVGIDLSWKQRDSVEDLFKHADIALYRAKAVGKNTYQVFAQDFNRRL